jgi:N-acetylmuramoyl-L-alanine amidase
MYNLIVKLRYRIPALHWPNQGILQVPDTLLSGVLQVRNGMLAFVMFRMLMGTALAQGLEDRIVVAQQGEGIYAILRRMDLPPEVYLEEFIALNRHKLDSTNQLVAGMTYLVPEVRNTETGDGLNLTENAGASLAIPSDTRLYPIFGDAYSQVPAGTEDLRDATIYLVSGHGGPDPGAIGIYGNHAISEDEYAYDVTLRLALNLIKHGADVHIIVQDPDDGIRDDAVLKMDNDETVLTNRQIPLNQRQRLKQRTEVINDLHRENTRKYNRVIAIHVDSRSAGELIDVFFYHHQSSAGGRNLAYNLHKTFKSKYTKHQPGRRYHGTVTPRSGLFIIKHTTPPVVYIELGNIKNPRDQKRLVVHNNRQALANWITEGIIADYRTR